MSELASATLLLSLFGSESSDDLGKLLIFGDYRIDACECMCLPLAGQTLHDCEERWPDVTRAPDSNISHNPVHEARQKRSSSAKLVRYVPRGEEPAPNQ
jgi:hypothetical protein